jgi:hypothetical protein
MHLKKTLQNLLAEPITWVLMVGFGIRLYACLNIYIINPDGVHYIYQAKSIYYGSWKEITACQIKFVSNLPFLIAAFFPIFQDWLVAARAVSMVFSFATLIPLYFLLNHFTDKHTSSLTTLVFAMIPVFVSRSADVVRGPVFWFLLTLGLLLFVKSLAKPSRSRFQFGLFFSALCFLLAAWTRIEGVVFLAGAGLYLLVFDAQKKITKLLSFASPILIIGIGIIAASTISDKSLLKMSKLEQITTEVGAFTEHYAAVRGELRKLAHQYTDYIGQFMTQTRSVVWFIPIALIFNYVLEGYFYPYVLIFIIGFIGIGKRIQQDRRVLFFLLTAALCIIVLYVHLLHNWMIFNRFIAILIFSTAVIIGYGVDNTLCFFKDRFGLKPLTAVWALAACILLAGLPKNLSPLEKDKVIYAQIGQIIAERKTDDEIVKIASAKSNAYMWAFFYAHRNYPAPLCFKQYNGKILRKYRKFVKYLNAKKIRYVLWEEKEWPHDHLDFLSSPHRKNFRLLGQWHHKDSGKMMLFEINTSPPSSG